MPSIITHALVGAAIARAAGPRPTSLRLVAVAGVLAMLPDADTLPVMAGVPGWSYEDHRGASHSLLFASAAGTTAALLLFRSREARGGWSAGATALLLSLVTATHGVLDAFTDGGSGIGFLWPFDDGRHFAPWTPVAVAPLSISAFLGWWGLRVLASEALWIWLPAGILLWAAERRRRPPGRSPGGPELSTGK